MAEKLDWLRRFVFTTIGFLFWGVAGTLLQLVLYPYARKHKHGDLQTQLKVRRLGVAGIISSAIYPVPACWR